VSKLLEAIEAEVRGDYTTAAAAYEALTDVGSALDRIGIYQALARCREKAGELRDAAPWRRKAAHGYMALPDDVMPKDERRYYALVEARNAVGKPYGLSFPDDPEARELLRDHPLV